jgi:(4-(4-[2-(gamma-L-glutamylamino)ethyl]phenoxymethyl)furan-2-yl)methanamine synthase
VSRLFGWDIGGAHLKAATLDLSRRRPRLHWRLASYEIWKGREALAGHLRRMREQLAYGGGRSGAGAWHAVTMTAELSDVFPGRDAGVRFVLSACRRALGPRVLVIDHRGLLLPLLAARRMPHRVAAANWMATATVAARALGGEGLLIDVGSTTTDIVPLSGGLAVPRGRTDLRRLASRELVYTGVLRTPPAAIADRVPAGSSWLRPAPEHFTIMADVWRLLGRLDAADYTVPTPDGRGRSVLACASRLARLVCAEPSELGKDGVIRLARFLARRQISVIADAVRHVRATRPGARRAVVAGAGAFLGAAAARRAGLRTQRMTDLVPGLGTDWDRVAPAACLALLLAEKMK